MPLDGILRAWSLMRLEPEDELNPPASPVDFVAMDRAGVHVPAPLRTLYESHNGGSILGGNLQFYPLRPSSDEEFAVLNLSDRLRGWGWPVPPEMLTFGGNGQGESFGVWTVQGVSAHPVVEIGAIFAEGCLSVVATNLEAFLQAWTAYYLLLYEAEDIVLDSLMLPRELRFAADDLEDTTFDAICQWADPALPRRWTRRSYQDELTPADINAWLLGLGEPATGGTAP